MRKIPIASIIAMIFSAVVLIFQFVRISILSGELSITTQLPMQLSEEASLLTIIESTLSILIPLALFVISIMIVCEGCRKNPSQERINLFFKLNITPIMLMFVSAVESTFYFFVYESRFTLEYTWLELLTSILILTVYIFTINKKIKTGYLLMIVCLAFVLVEVFRFSFPEMSYAYVVGSNIHISTFLAAVLFYLAYLFLGLSLTMYRRRDNVKNTSGT
ncbi:MAG: hypothetical protein FWC09_08040 [Lachnospiraceae bacterium]|nr:hypothetical protein [Lachnospiraceae bacterium]